MAGVAGFWGRRGGRVLAAGLTLVAGCGAFIATAGPAAATTCAPSATFTQNDDNYSMNYGTPSLTVAPRGVLNNDTTSPAGQTLLVDADFSDSVGTSFGTVDWTLAAALGTDVFTASNGGFKYTPDTGFSGIETFQYFADLGCDRSDGGLESFDGAALNITVWPLAHNDSYSTPSQQALVVPASAGVLHNDAGYDSVCDNTNPAHGTLALDTTDGSFTYTPNAGFSGIDTFTYRVMDTDLDGLCPTATVTIQVGPVTRPNGYWMVTQKGTVFPFGQVKNWGNVATFPVTHFEPTPSKLGYWIVNSAGQVFPRGDAHSFGNAGALKAGEIVSSMSSTPTGKGYWLFTSRGRVFPSLTLKGPIVGSIATPSGNGYYMVGSDGGIFCFGDAVFRGSMGGKPLNKPVESLVPTADNRGYWLVASDGGIFAFGNAPFRGSMGGVALAKPVVGMVRYGNGYLMVSSDGGVFDFSNLPFLGSLGSHPPSSPVVSIAA